MKLTFDLSDLKKGVKVVKDAIDNKSDIDLIKGIMIDVAQEDEVSLKGTNRSIGIECQVPATIEDDEEDSIVGTSEARIVMPKEFVKLVSKLKGSEVDMDYNPETRTMVLRCAGNRFNLQCDSASNYPVFPERNDIWQYEIDQDVIKKALERVSVTMSKNKETNAILRGVLFDVSEFIQLASTDRFRLSTETVMTDTDWMDECDEVIPAEAVKILKKQLSEDNEKTLKICFEDDKMYFEIGGDMDILLHGAMLHGDFPSISQVIPGSTEFDVTVNREDLKDSLEMIDPLAEGFEIRFDADIDNEKLYITSHSTTIGQGVANIPIDSFNGDPVSISCEGDIVLESIKKLDSEKVVLGFTDNTGSAVIEMEDNDDYKYVYMPLQTNIEPPAELEEEQDDEKDEEVKKTTAIA